MINVLCKTFAGCLLFGVLSVQAAAYRWVDEKGQVHFGDQPGGSQSQQIKTRPGSATPRADQQRRIEKTYQLLDAYETDRRRKQEQKAKRKEQAEKQKRNCALARDRQRQYTDAGRIYRLDNDGKRSYMSDQERESLLQRSRENVARWCK
jgi:hypothetical protein